MEGRVRIELDDGVVLDLGPGDVASVVAGSHATWHVETAFKELVVLSTTAATPAICE